MGQEENTDSIACEQVTSNMVTQYLNKVGTQLRIYNGFEYKVERVKIGHPYFGSGIINYGSIVFDDVMYPKIAMLYDIVNDELVIPPRYDITHFTYLDNKHITLFTIQQHTFVRLTEDSVKGSELKPGFYQRLYNGKIKLWLKDKKVLEEYIEPNSSLQKRAIEHKLWYIYKDGKYFLIEGKQSILKLFRERKKELKQFIKNENIRFKNNMDNDLFQIVAYYDEITK